MRVKNDNREVSKPKDIITEFKGFEIEEKFQLTEIPKASFLTERKDALLKDSQFESCVGFENLGWVFHFDYYVFKEEIDSILKEFKLFSELLLSSHISSKLIPTKLTKYEWLLKIANEPENKNKRFC